MGTVHKRAGMCNRNRFQTRLLARIEEQKHGSVPNTQFLGRYSMLNSNYRSILHQFEEKHLRGDLSSAHSAMFYCTFLFRYALYPNLHDFDTLNIVSTAVANSNYDGLLRIFIYNGSILYDKITRVEPLAISLNVGFPGKNVMRPHW